MEFDAGWDYGTYPMKICADGGNRIAETNETNNCKRLHPFFVVPFLFDGRVSGTAPLNTFVFPGVTLSWAGRVKLDISNGARSGNDGIFEYETSEALLTYRVQGTNTLNGCSWSGMGDYAPALPTDDIELSFGRRRPFYSTQNPVEYAFKFTATVTCPSGSTYEAEVSPSRNGLSRWLDTGQFVKPFRDPGLTGLRGHHTDTTRQAGHVTYRWNLDAGP